MALWEHNAGDKGEKKIEKRKSSDQPKRRSTFATVASAGDGLFKKSMSIVKSLSSKRTNEKPRESNDPVVAMQSEGAVDTKKLSPREPTEKEKEAKKPRTSGFSSTLN